MKGIFSGKHRQFLFRTYLFLVAGLLLTAIVLDMGFDYLQSTQSPREDRWISSSFDLIERELLAVPEEERIAIARTLSRETGFGVQLMSQDEIVTFADSPQEMTTLVDANGNNYYLREAPALQGLIRLGPVAEEEDRFLLTLLPPLFYLSIFVVVGLWLRPLLKDLDLITDAAHRFAADYREPLSTASSTTQLTSLAHNLDDMSARLSGLIRSQKELIAALSHEMRTPLARIRFALAVIGNKDNDDKDIQNQLGELNNDVLEVDQLIGTMLNYARLDHPELQMNWQDVPLTEWMRQTTDRCRQPDKEITVAKDENLDIVQMDPRLMSLAVSNLLVNASRYAHKAVHCTVRKTDEKYLFMIEDDGKGIPENERESIFKAFTRIDDSRNRETGGYGLGLAIVARIAALHGGSVSAGDSKNLGGAMFTLTWGIRSI